VSLSVQTTDSPFTRNLTRGRVLKIPIAHAEGNYYADRKTVRSLEENDQVLFRYCNQSGEITEEANPNGSIGNIAGVMNREKNVLGMMPHPERCAEAILGNADGRFLFESLLLRGQAWRRR